MHHHADDKDADAAEKAQAHVLKQKIETGDELEWQADDPW